MFLLASMCLREGMLPVVDWQRDGTEIVDMTSGLQRNVAYGAIRSKEHAMQGSTRELWMTLCEQAAVEQDPIRLLELVKQINDLLEMKEKRLREKRLREKQMQQSAGSEC